MISLIKDIAYKEEIFDLPIIAPVQIQIPQRDIFQDYDTVYVVFR